MLRCSIIQPTFWELNLFLLRYGFFDRKRGDCEKRNPVSFGGCGHSAGGV